MSVLEEIDCAADAIRRRHKGDMPKTAIILGSGLGPFGDDIEVETAISYGDIPGFPVSTVKGHSGRLLIGTCAGLPIAVMQGRMHLYEGYEAAKLALPVRTLWRLGIERLVVTNAAGSLRMDMPPGSIMLITDHINFTGSNPLVGPNEDAIGPRFFDMGDAWSKELRGKLLAAAEASGVSVDQGVYVQVKGPNFETPAEIRMFSKWGGDAVGMSTVPECLVAHHCGIKVLGLSLMTNYGAGMADEVLSHDHTQSEADKAYSNMKALLFQFFGDLKETE